MGFFGQYGRLVLIFIKLKSWRFLFMIVVIAALFSNNYLYDVVNFWMQRMGENDLQEVGPKEFSKNNVLLSMKSKSSREMDNLTKTASRMSNTDFSPNVEECDSEEACNSKYFQNLIGKRSGMLAHFVKYRNGSGNTTRITCQMSTGSELHCPFLSYLVRMSQLSTSSSDHEFHSTSVFRIMSKIATFETAKRGEKTICKTDANFPVVFLKTVMVKAICVLITLVFYLFVSTVTCIYELKQHGYLQLMFRKGLGVLAYWFALWTITLLEMAIFAALYTVAYMLQCSGFFTSNQLVNTFLGAFIQFCGVAAVMLSFVVLTRRITISGAYASMYLLAAVLVVVANRNYLFDGPNIVKYILLVVPAGHLAEQTYEQLLDDVVQRNDVTKSVLLISGGLLGLTVIATIYFDFVLKAGNGWRLPCYYYFNLGFWSRPKRRPLDDEREASVMIETAQHWWKSIITTRGLKKSFESCLEGPTLAVSNFTAIFYQDQISAIVGHNGSGKSTLMQILSGERNASAGLATIDRIPVTESLTRYHICSSIGYCPQSDALVDRMSVSDTVKLAVLSTGRTWAQSEKQVCYILSSLGIENKLGESIQNLSFSEKRKVSVTLALIGEPRVVLLDDASRDMDYISKRRMWQLLHEFKIGHSVVVSTLFIDEAEAVADRILFLSGGRIICAGSPFFFKRAFDCRFIIQIASKTEFHVPLIIRRVTSKFKSVRVRSFSNADVEFEVSIMEDTILSVVIAEIEKLSQLIDEFGIVHYSLEDVFSKLKSLPAHEVDRHFELGTIGYVADDVDRIKDIMKRKPTEPPDVPTKVKRAPSMMGAIYAMILSSVFQTYRSKVRIVTRIVLPCVLVVLIGLGAILERSQKNDKVSLLVSLSNTSTFENKNGICIFPHSTDMNIHYDSLNKKDCAEMLHPNLDHSEDVTPLGLLVEKFPQGDLQRAIMSKKNMDAIKLACKKSQTICPIIFGNDFCPDRKPPSFKKNHSISVGAFITGSKYAPADFVTASIQVYGYMLSTMIKKYYKNAAMETNMSITAEGILDIKGTFFQFYGLFILVIFLSVIPVLFLDDIIHDKRSGVRSQLLSMGLSLPRYWICKFVSHWLQLVVYYLISIIPLLVLLSSGYASLLFIISIMPLTMVFGLSNGLLAAYAVSTLVKEVSYLIIAFYALFSLLVSLSALLVQSNDFSGELLIFLLPQYATIAPSFYGMRFAYYSLSYYTSMGHKTTPSLLEFFLFVPHLRDSLITLPIHSILLILLLVLLENRHKCCRNGDAVTEPRAYEHCQESAILNEIENVINAPKSRDHLMQVSVLKAMESDGAIALRNLTFGLKPGEVFGLIGPCGCGKTHAVRAIVGDEKQTRAGQVDLQVDNNWLPNIEVVRQGRIGYCPRTDPLYHRLTVRENLNFYASVIGVPDDRVKQLAKDLFLEQDFGIQIQRANVGQKRRLTLAIALLADPLLVAIDDVSAGVDHDGRQILWGAIRSLVSKRRGIVLATQCMEEAESLCDRMCIMNHGMMVALSTINDLILRYKKMYFLEMQISSTSSESVDCLHRRKNQLANIVLDRFYGAILIEQWTARMQFAVPIQSIGCLSAALDWLHDSKTRLSILYFTLHYATIDQVMKAIVVHSEYQALKNVEQQASVSV